MQNHSVSQVDGAMYRYDALDMTKRRDAQYHFMILFPGHSLSCQQLENIGDYAAMSQPCQFLKGQYPGVSHRSPAKSAWTSITCAPEVPLVAQRYATLDCASSGVHAGAGKGFRVVPKLNKSSIV